MSSETLTVPNHRLLATCWTWAGDAAPGRGDEKSPLDVRTRIETVAAAGWDGVGFIHADLLETRETIGFPALRRSIAEAGLSIVELEFLTDWWRTDERRSTSDEWRALLFSAAEELGAQTIKVGGDPASLPTGDAEFMAALDALASEAATRGARIAVEPMPMNNIRTLQRGMQLVGEIDNPALGLCVDSWHVRRGGTEYRDLGSFLDISKVFVVELVDALEAITGDSLWVDAVDHRLNPGEGELELTQFVAEIVRLGWTGHWGVEVISEAQRRKSFVAAVADSRAAAAETLRQADYVLNNRY